MEPEIVHGCKKHKEKDMELLCHEQNMSATVKCQSIIKRRNKGKGAGGAKTNEHGLFYENQTRLDSKYKVISKYTTHEIVSVGNMELELVHVPQGKFMPYMKDRADEGIKICHGAKKPDDCFINEGKKHIYWIEKKYQTTSGSVCEKIQGAGCKRTNIKSRYPGYEVTYILWLTEWFKKNCEGEMEYLSSINIPIFWSSDEDSKEKIMSIITK